MNVTVDYDRCQGHGQCEFVAPEVFELDDDSELRHDSSPDESLRPLVLKAMRACPVQAIRVAD